MTTSLSLIKTTGSPDRQAVPTLLGLSLQFGIGRFNQAQTQHLLKGVTRTIYQQTIGDSPSIHHCSLHCPQENTKPTNLISTGKHSTTPRRDTSLLLLVLVNT